MDFCKKIFLRGETQEETEASRFMLRMDPPDHDRIRRLVSKAFTPRALDAIRPAIQSDGTFQSPDSLELPQTAKDLYRMRRIGASQGDDRLDECK